MAAIKLLIATPCAHDIVDANYASTMFYVGRILTRLGIESDIQILGASDLEVTRSLLASRFFADQSYTHLLFVDSDMCFRLPLVRRMLEFDQDFVSAIYPKRQLDLTKLLRSAGQSPAQDTDVLVSRNLDYVGAVQANVSPEDEHKLDIIAERGFAKADHTGMGVCLLKRRVLEDMVSHDLVYQSGKPHGISPWPVPYYGFFHKERLPSGIIFSEDISFCRRWRQGCGGTIWACVDEPIDHIGNFRYSGNFAERLKAGEL